MTESERYEPTLPQLSARLDEPRVQPRLGPTPHSTEPLGVDG